MTAEELAEIVDAREQAMGTMMLTERIHAGLHELSYEDATRFATASAQESYIMSKQMAKVEGRQRQSEIIARALCLSFLIGLEVGRELERRV